MPKTPIDFSKTIIYKIWKDDDFYVGSTTDFTTRKYKHKNMCNDKKCKMYNLKVYQTIRDKGGWNAWEMIPLEEYVDCKSRTQARIREEEWRVKLNADLNTRKAYCSDKDKTANHLLLLKQYYQTHIDERKAYFTQYYEKHSVKICENQSQKVICVCGCEIRKDCLKRHMKSQKHQDLISDDT
jgi:predicted GIY-YIG superfamily endonuclease